MHSKLTKLAFVAAIIALASAVPTPAKRGLSTNTCERKDTLARKQLFRSKGATVEDIAISIQETDCSMSSVNVDGKYPYGDGKQEGSACFGPFKNNWYAIKTYCSHLSVFAGKDMNDWHTGALLNDDDNLAAAITCQHQQMSGTNESGRENGFWAVQRNGETPGGCAIDPIGYTYHNGVEQIVTYLNMKTASGTHLDDNTVIDPPVQAC